MNEADFEQQEAHRHTKRLARELAMQYLFSNDLAEEAPDGAKWQLFRDQAAENHNLSDNRFGRKVLEYGEKLVNGIYANRSDIDQEIGKHTENWDLNRLALVDRNVLRVAVFEMLYIDDVPPVVSINEAVEIVRDYSGAEAGNFVNGILNSIMAKLDRPQRCKRQAD